MLQEPEEQEWIRRWEGLYQELLQNSRQQLDIVQAHAQDEDFADSFDTLLKEWARIKHDISSIEDRLSKRINDADRTAIFKEKIAPLLQETLSNSHAASREIEQRLTATGKTIRSTKDHWQAMRAYYRADQEGQIPIFFDEKK